MTKYILLVFLSVHTLCAKSQATLKVYVNNQDVTENNYIGINSNDVIHLVVKGDGVTKYRFEKVTYEILLKNNAGEQFKKKSKLGPFLQQEQSQVGRKDSIKEADLIKLCSLYNFGDDKYAIAPELQIRCDLLPGLVLSRIILHVKKVSKLINGKSQNVELNSLGDFERLFSDGISFWSTN